MQRQMTKWKQQKNKTVKMRHVPQNLDKKNFRRSLNK